jgi:hypothetical protein
VSITTVTRIIRTSSHLRRNHVSRTPTSLSIHLNLSIPQFLLCLTHRPRLIPVLSALRPCFGLSPISTRGADGKFDRCCVRSTCVRPVVSLLTTATSSAVDPARNSSACPGNHYRPVPQHPHAPSNEHLSCTTQHPTSLASIVDSLLQCLLTTSR